MARTKKTRRNKLREENARLSAQILCLDRMLHDKDEDLRKEEERNSFTRNNFELITTILNTTRHNLKQLARQYSKERNIIAACVFEFLYADIANLDKYKRLMKKHEAGKDEVPEPIPNVDFGIPECDKF